MEEKVSHLHERRLLGKLIDRIATVEQDSLFTVDVGDRALAARSGGEARVVGEHPGLAVQFADIDDFRAHRSLQKHELMVCSLDAQCSGLVGHASRSVWSAMRARLSSRPNSTSTSNIPGDVVRPVRAARSGWASLPSFTPVPSATSRMAASRTGASQFESETSWSGAKARSARASSVRRALASASMAIGRLAKRKR